jgi:GNAT superfamily N-acetyltransferase
VSRAGPTPAPILPILPGALDDLRVRPYRGPEDHPGLSDLWAETAHAAGSDERTSVGSLDAWFGQPRNMDPRTDMVLVEDATGRPVAVALVRWVDRNTTGERSFETSCDVRLAHRRRGIGAALLAWQEARIDEISVAMTDLGDRPTLLAAYVMDADIGGRALVERAGFVAVRRSSEMQRPDLEAIPDVPSPDGITIGGIDRPDDEEVLRRVWHVGGEVFAGHWGDPVPDRSEAAWRRFRDDPDVQPALWCVAFDGDEIVGHILSYLAEDHDGTPIGWTEGIAVREAWRRRGIARAMLAWSLRRVREAGAVRAALGVDLQNPNQALTLYESLGFRVTASETEYHRPYRVPGRHEG